jgi:hypothetical protein
VRADLTSTVDNLRTLAVAAASPGGPLYNNATLISDIVSAVSWFLSNSYGSVSTHDNWWDWEIGRRYAAR